VRRNAFGLVAALAVLVIHGVLLWIIVPLGTLVWLVTLQPLARPAVTLGAFLGWIDNNIAFVLARVLFRPMFPDADVAWVRTRDRHAIKHRISFGHYL
jgi:type IV secretory pathway TrbD component